MDNLNLDKFRLILKKEEDDIYKSISLGKEMLLVDNDGDHVDRIQCDMLSGVQDQLSARNLKRLTELSAAQKRIKDNSFGICEDCEEDIPYKRLLFNPCIGTCVVCAESREL